MESKRKQYKQLQLHYLLNPLKRYSDTIGDTRLAITLAGAPQSPPSPYPL